MRPALVAQRVILQSTDYGKQHRGMTRPDWTCLPQHLGATRITQ